MICASSSKTRRLGIANPNKETILNAMRRFEPSGIAEGFVDDYATGEVVASVVDGAYEVGDLFCTVSDMWNLEHNDLELDEAFCDLLLERAEMVGRL